MQHKALPLVPPDSSIYGRGVRSLQALCRRSELLPGSCRLLSTNIALLDQYPISSSAMSDVYRAQCGSRDVAVKSLRVHKDNRAEVEKVSDDVRFWAGRAGPGRC